MERGLYAYAALIAFVRQALFYVAAVVAVIALLDWLVRTRRLSPFGPIARFCRKFVDPLMAPVERRIVRAGGLPTSAPWWTLVFVVVGGLILIWLLNFLLGLFASLAVSMQTPGGLVRMLIAWAFSFLRFALIVRVISSWFQISPYSRWVYWSFVMTEWMLAPLRRIIPMLGPVDITPIVAFFLLSILQGAIGSF